MYNEYKITTITKTKNKKNYQKEDTNVDHWIIFKRKQTKKYSKRWANWKRIYFNRNIGMKKISGFITTMNIN